MRGSETLIPARFLTLLSHLCVVVTLLWESQRTVRSCLPSQFHEHYLLIYHNRLLAGMSASVALILVQMTTFILGITMFSSTLCIISIACHGSASVALTYFVLGGWLCDWFWWIFISCNVLPFTADLLVAMLTMCSIR